MEDRALRRSASPKGKRVTHGAEDKTAIRVQRASVFDELGRFVPNLVAETKWGTFLVDTSDSRVGRKLFVNQGRSEMRTLRNVMRALEELGQASRVLGKTFVDVGANIGTTTIPALLVHGFSAAIAFEPEPSNFRLLRVNAILNGLDDRVRALQVAVSDVAGSGTLLVHGDNSGAHQLVGSGSSGADEFTGSIQVRLVSLDQLVAESVLDPTEVGLLWIDVQGHEGSVLRGATKLVERSIPVVLEFDAVELERSGDLESVLDVAAGYGHYVDMRAMDKATQGPQARRPISELRAFAEAAAEADTGFTDLLLV